MPRAVFLALAAVIAVASACGQRRAPQERVHHSEIPSDGTVAFHADVWADNWFALYLGEELLIEDSVPITTERSFNAESFDFRADYPLQLNFVIKDFKENDTGLEYIGTRRQQMGDGGFIAQLTDNSTGQTIAVSSAGWQCLVVHEAPLDKSCEGEPNPVAGEAPCEFRAPGEPAGWKSSAFEPAGWVAATEHSEEAVVPRHGYDEITWHPDARIIWAGDLETDNTVLCRATIPKPSD